MIISSTVSTQINVLELMFCLKCLTSNFPYFCWLLLILNSIVTKEQPTNYCEPGITSFSQCSMGGESQLCLQIIAVLFLGFSWNKVQISKQLEKFLDLKLETFQLCRYLSLAGLSFKILRSFVFVLFKNCTADSMEVFVLVFFFYFLL